jgi:hypothetical protein
VVSQITQFNSNFVINEKEKNFIKELINNIETSGLDYRQIKLHRLASGSLQFTYEKGWYIGSINLQSEYSSMQILKGLYVNKVYTFETITEYVNLIPKWINYIKYCKRTDSIEH